MSMIHIKMFKSRMILKGEGTISNYFRFDFPKFTENIITSGD